MRSLAFLDVVLVRIPPSILVSSSATPAIPAWASATPAIPVWASSSILSAQSLVVATLSSSRLSGEAFCVPHKNFPPFCSLVYPHPWHFWPDTQLFNSTPAKLNESARQSEAEILRLPKNFETNQQNLRIILSLPSSRFTMFYFLYLNFYPFINLSCFLPFLSWQTV